MPITPTDTLNAFVIYALLGLLSFMITVLGAIIWAWVQSIKVSINHLRNADEELRKLVQMNCDQIQTMLAQTNQKVALVDNTVEHERLTTLEFKVDFKEFKDATGEQLTELIRICSALTQQKS